MRKGESEVLREELLEVWAFDIIGLLEFNDLEDLRGVRLGQYREL